MSPLRLTDDQCSSISDISEWPIVSNTLEHIHIKRYRPIIWQIDFMGKCFSIEFIPPSIQTKCLNCQLILFIESNAPQ